MSLRTILDAWLSGKVAPPPVVALIGIRITGYDEGTGSCELEIGNQHLNPMGRVHGGIVADLADAAMGIAAATVANEGESFSTLELSLNFFLPVKDGMLKANANVVRRGRRTAYVECEIRDEAGLLVAKAGSTTLFHDI